MELLGGYVDSDEEEEEGQAEQEQEQPAGVLPGFESYSRPKTDAAKPSLGTQPAGSDPSDSPATSISGLPDRLRGSLPHGLTADSDGTPGGASRHRLHHFKIVSKSSTPVIHGSPALHQNAPSDDSTPNSPARRSGLTAVADMPPPVEVTLPDKPAGEVEKAVADRVEHYMRLRGTPEPVRVNRDLYDKKEFHNPGILEMLMTQYRILETGSNYPKVQQTHRAHAEALSTAACRHAPSSLIAVLVPRKAAALLRVRC